MLALACILHQQLVYYTCYLTTCQCSTRFEDLIGGLFDSVDHGAYDLQLVQLLRDLGFSVGLVIFALFLLVEEFGGEEFMLVCSARVGIKHSDVGLVSF